VNIYSLSKFLFLKKPIDLMEDVMLKLEEIGHGMLQFSDIWHKTILWRI